MKTSRIWHAALVLGILAATCGAESWLGDCFNNPVFPSEASLAVIAGLLLILCVIQLFVVLINRWTKGTSEHEEDNS